MFNVEYRLKAGMTVNMLILGDNVLMPNINVQKQSTSDDITQYLVTVQEGDSKTEHVVLLTQNDFERYAGKRQLQEVLIKDSFRFLLDRESKEAILSEFNLSMIKRLH